MMAPEAVTPIRRPPAREDVALAQATHELAERWRAVATTMRPYAEGPARAFATCADDLDRLAETWGAALLTLAEASALSGYSVAHLRRMLKQGDIKDAADTGPTLLRRGDVPIKPGHHLSRAA